MVKTPNPEQLKELLAAAKAFDWRDGEKRLRSALGRVGRSEKPSRDGFPAVTIGGNGGGTGGRSGHGDPTATAATAAASGARVQDPLVTHTTRAIVALKDCVRAQDRFIGELARIDTLADAPEPEKCSLLSRYGVTEESFRSTEEHGPLGRWAYEYQRRHKGRLPGREEVEAHLEGKRVR